jgi:hypothetical protein
MDFFLSSSNAFIVGFDLSTCEPQTDNGAINTTQTTSEIRAEIHFSGQTPIELVMLTSCLYSSSCSLDIHGKLRTSYVNNVN